MRRRTFLAVGLGALLAPAATPARAAESYTTYAQLLEHAARWRKGGATVDVPGTSLLGRDLLRVRVGTGPITVLVTGRLHANEPSGTEACVRLVDLLLGDPRSTFGNPRLPGVRPDRPLFRALAQHRQELLKRVTLVVLPMLDPDGAEAGGTRNQLLNLDYTTRLAAQTGVIADTVALLEPDTYVDLHGGPNAPDLNVGYISPDGVEPAVQAAGIAAARTMWRAADALGMELAYFEEHPLELVLGVHGEPIRSVDRAYYDALTGALPLTQQGFALEGLPSVYLETVGLQSTAPTITISEGASAQQASLAGLLLELSGLLTGERPRKVVRPPASFDLKLPAGSRDLRVTVHWGRGVYSDPTGPLQDYQLQVGAVSSAPGRPSAVRRSRAVVVERPGRVVRVSATPSMAGLDDSAVLRVTWREPDSRRRVTGVLGDPERVHYCLDDGSLWDTVAPQYSGPAC